VTLLDLSGSYFEYNGTTSRKYGLIFAHLNTDEVNQMNGEIESSVVFNKKGKRNYFIGESFEDSPLKFEAEIVMDSDKVINRFMRREIEKWLFHQHNYCKLYADMDCDTYGEAYELVNGVQKRLYLNCRFINPEKIESGNGLIGYKFMVECDSCMAWQDTVTYNYNLSGSSSIIKINVDSDLRDYVYPKVTIQTGSSGGDIQIINFTDNPTRPTSFINLSPGITITMRGDGVNYISGDYYQKFSNKNFIRLLDGENELNITGDIKQITFEFQNRRYL
jgi:phage-related protein